jgi:AcrR family transcriptional regulator
VNSGSFYYFFKKKENLLLAVLDHHSEVMHERIFGPIRRSSLSPVGKVFAVLGFYRDFLQDTDFEIGCPIGNLALELGNPSDRVRKRLSEVFDSWCDGIRGFLVEASGELPTDTDHDALARFVLTVMEGGVMQARTARSLQPFDDSVDALQSHFEMLKQRM